MSAVFLVVGLFVHFLVLHFMTERPITMEKVAERLRGPGWLVFDSILLVICLYHALNGINSIILDFNPGKRFTRIFSWVLWITGGATAVVGVLNLIPFGR